MSDLDTMSKLERKQQQMTQFLATAIQSVLQLTGLDGTFILLAKTTPEHTAIIAHGVSAEDMQNALREAYQRSSGIVLADKVPN